MCNFVKRKFSDSPSKTVGTTKSGSDNVIVTRRKRQLDYISPRLYRDDSRRTVVPSYIMKKFLHDYAENANRRTQIIDNSFPNNKIKNIEPIVEKSSVTDKSLDTEISVNFTEINEETLGSKRTAQIPPPLVKMPWVPRIHHSSDGKLDTQRIAKVAVGIVFLVAGFFSIRCIGRGCKFCCSSLTKRIAARRRERALEAEKNALPNSLINYPRQQRDESNIRDVHAALIKPKTTAPPLPPLPPPRQGGGSPVTLQPQPVLVTDSTIRQPQVNASTPMAWTKNVANNSRLNNSVDNLMAKLAKSLKTTATINSSNSTVVTPPSPRPVVTWIRPSNSLSSQPIPVTPFKRSFERQIPPALPDFPTTSKNRPVCVSADVHKVSSENM